MGRNRQLNLARVYRGKWLQALKAHALRIVATIPEDWVVDCKPVGSGHQALTYLGKYLYQGVLNEHNILNVQQGKVTFQYTENSGEMKTRTLPGADFLWLLLQHVLPKGFRRARDYGFLHTNSKAMIQLLQWLFHVVVHPVAAISRPIIVCQHCGAEMVILATRLRPQVGSFPIT